MIFCVLNPQKIWHQQLVHLPTSPVYCIATLPWEIQKNHVQQYYSYILQIIYIISEENKLLPPYLSHLKNVKVTEIFKVGTFLRHNVDFG